MPHAFNIRIGDPRVHAYAQKYCFPNGPDTALNARLRAEVLANERGLSAERGAGRISFVSPKAQREIEVELLATLRVPEALGIDAGTRAAWIKNLGWKVASRRAFRATRDRC